MSPADIITALFMAKDALVVSVMAVHGMHHPEIQSNIDLDYFLMTTHYSLLHDYEHIIGIIDIGEQRAIL